MPNPFRAAGTAATALLALALTLPSAPAKAGLDPFVGEVMLVGFNWCPRGYAAANGQLLPIAQNAALFSLLGTIYGGDGRNTFALPDLRGRMPVGYGAGPDLSDIPIGARSGAEQVTLTQMQLPSHTHTATTDVTADVTAKGTNQQAAAVSPAGNVMGGTAANSEVYNAGPADQAMGDSAVEANISATTTIGAAGGNQPVEIRNPYLAMTWCIALDGVYPPRP